MEVEIVRTCFAVVIFLGCMIVAYAPSIWPDP